MGECYKYQTYACSLFIHLWINKVTLYAINNSTAFFVWYLPLSVCYAQGILATVDCSMKCLKLGMSYLGEIFRIFLLPKFFSWLSFKIFISVFFPDRYCISQDMLFLFSFRQMPVQNINASSYIPSDSTFTTSLSHLSLHYFSIW